MGLYFVTQLFIGVVASVNPISSFPQALQNRPCRQCFLVSHQHETGTSRGISNYGRKLTENFSGLEQRASRQPFNTLDLVLEKPLHTLGTGDFHWVTSLAGCAQ